MRLITYPIYFRPEGGVLNGKRVRPLPGWTCRPRSLPKEQALALAGASTETELALSSLTLLAPIPEPRRNIMCLGMNYAAHAAESLRGQESAESRCRKCLSFSPRRLHGQRAVRGHPLRPWRKWRSWIGRWSWRW